MKIFFNKGLAEYKDSLLIWRKMCVYGKRVHIVGSRNGDMYKQELGEKVKKYNKQRH